MPTPIAKGGYLYAVQPNEAISERLNAFLRTRLQNQDKDEYGEQRVALLPSSDNQILYNGGAFIESFGRGHVSHSHQDDDRQLKDQYLLIFPRGGDISIDLAVWGFPPSRERHNLKEGMLYLWHFDASCGHTFTMAGNNPDATLLAIAFHAGEHTTNLATQTNVLDDPITKYFNNGEYSAETIPVLTDEKNTLIETMLVNAQTALAKATLVDQQLPSEVSVCIQNSYGRTAAIELVKMAKLIAAEGVGYGNSDFNNMGFSQQLETY
jgi:hypothetical protein